MNQTEINNVIQKQRLFFNSGKTKGISFRIRQLKKLKTIIKKNEKVILQAIKLDMNRHEFEGYVSEISPILTEINYITNNLKEWAKPKKVRTAIIHFLSWSYIYTEPLGVVLIIGPWNYPFQLIGSPLLGAIAAGNCVVLKPSEIAVHTSRVIAEIIKDNFEENYIAVVEGDVETTQILLSKKFDYIFFTGGTSIGKIVMEAAAKNLTPVTLELGGKSPCIVDCDVNIDYTAKRIVWGKFFNAGQTCVAPDYLLVNKKIKEKLLQAIKKYIIKFYGDTPSKSVDYARIINENHFNRLTKLLTESDIVIGGDSNLNDRYIAPTVIDNVLLSQKIMEEEIFGPILPIIHYNNLSEAISIVNGFPKPLALYFFSRDNVKQKKILKETSSGGVCINDTMIHLASTTLPFGGIGHSGMGSYHGKASFDTFSHQKSTLKKSFLFDINLRYPPYKNKLKSIKKFL